MRRISSADENIFMTLYGVLARRSVAAHGNRFFNNDIMFAFSSQMQQSPSDTRGKRIKYGRIFLIEVIQNLRKPCSVKLLLDVVFSSSSISSLVSSSSNSSLNYKFTLRVLRIGGL